MRIFLKTVIVAVAVGAAIVVLLASPAVIGNNL